VFVRFFVRKITLYARITVNRQRCRNDFSIGERVKPPKNPKRPAEGEWDVKAQCVKGSGQEAMVLSAKLDAIRAKIKGMALDLSNKGVQYSADTLKDLFTGKSKLHYTFIEVSEKHLLYLSLLPTDQVAAGTISTYQSRHANIVEFLKAKGLTHVSCEEFSPTIATQCLQYLRVERSKPMNQNTASKNLQLVKKVIRWSINQEWSKHNPLQAFIIKKPRQAMPPYLSEEERDLLTMKIFPVERLQKIKDCFLFCCHTGLSFADVKVFRASEHVIIDKGRPWIEMSRLKTGIDFYVPLTAVAQQILKRYGGEQLPVPSNVKFNAYLKEIQDICGIKTKLTVRVARTTFGVVMLNDMNQDLETVSKMLGHASTKITERHYTQVLKRKIVRNLVTNNPTLYDSL
jgi:integrase/recombinase XerD